MVDKVNIIGEDVWNQTRPDERLELMDKCRLISYSIKNKDKLVRTFIFEDLPQTKIVSLGDPDRVFNP